MAEFCLDCLNKLMGSKDSKWRYVLSWDKELCEECGQLKRVVITERLWSRVQRTVAEAAENLRRG